MGVRVWDREQDYDDLVRWWSGHGWDALPKEDLPDTGYIANECAYGCLYIDIHRRFAMMEWVVTDPDAPARLCLKSLNEVIDTLLSTAKNVGVKRVYSVLKHEKLAKLYEKHGFVAGDVQVQDMIWVGE
jgi:N-acetylglutamate synthase-like GNAT family acetyltransferase